MVAEPEIESPAISKLAGHELKTLFLHSSHYMAGLVANLVVGLVSFPIFTRVFSVAEYGLLDLAQRVILMLTIGSKAGLQNAVLRFYDKEQFAADPASARKYYSTMFLGALSTAAVVVLLFLGVDRLVPNTLITGPLTNLIYLISALVLLRALGAILWAFLRIEERTKAFNVTSVGTRAATVAVICALLPLAGRSVKTYLGGTILVETALVAGLTLWLLCRGLLDARRFDLPLFWAGALFGLPLVVYEFAFAILGSADRFLVRHYLGADALGFYSVAYALAQNANDLLVTPLGLAILPIYMRIWSSHGAEKTIEFLSIALDLFLVGSCGMLAIAAATAHPVVVLLASSKYAGVDHLIPILLAGLMIYATYIFVAAGLLIHKRTMQMAGLLVLAAMANIGLNCLLLPILGLNGSALATLLSYAFCTLLLARASGRFMALRIHPSSLSKYAAAAAAAWLAGQRIELGSPLMDILGRSALAASVYGVVLCALDCRARRAARWVLVQCQARI